MDPQRFDRLSKAVAGGVSRRDAVRAAGIGGLLAALLPWTSRGRRVEAAEVKTCVYDFTAVIAAGPSAVGGQTRQVAGELTIRIESGGNIEQGQLRAADGTTTRVVGQATGHAVNLRLMLPNGETYVAVGTSQRTVRACSGEMGGPASGPALGDAGSWTATATGAIGASPTAGAGTTSGVAGSGDQSVGTPEANQSTVGAECDLTCGGDTLGLDETTCTCLCPEGMASCISNIGASYSKGGTIFFPNPNTAKTGYCVDASSDAFNCGACRAVCASGPAIASSQCVSGACQYTCNEGYAQCSSDASDPCSTDLNFDSANCGACGVACGGGYQCNNGLCQCMLACLPPQDLDPSACTCVCSGGLTACGGGCVDTSSDVNNCGACGNACGPVASECANGTCIPLASQ